MSIKVKLDYDGIPYLEVIADTLYDEPEDLIIEQFIRRAKQKGVVVVNESSFDTSDSYITLRIKK